MLLSKLFHKDITKPAVKIKAPTVGGKNIFQFAHNVSELPQQLIDVVESHKKMNPDWDVFLIDDQFMFDFLAVNYGEHVTELYRKNHIPASRCDMARIMLVQHFGGVYVDLSYKFTVPLDSIVKDYELVLVQRDDFEKYKNDPSKAHFTNSFIYSKPKSIFLTACYNRVVKNLITKKYNFDVINATGPGVINSSLENFGADRLGIVSFKNGKNSLFDYVRVAGFSNSWLAEQSKGIFR